MRLGGVSTRVRMAHAAALLYAAGALFAVLALVLPHPADANERAIEVITGLAAAGALGLLVAPARLLPHWLFHVAIVGGTVLISGAIYSWRPGGIASAVALLYVWILLYAWYFFSFRWAIAHTVGVAVAYGVVLVVQDGNQAAATQWLVTVGTASIAGMLIGWLVHQVQELAQTDPLTGLANRRAFEEALDRELHRARRRREALCVAVIDIDHFKRVNDHGGHPAGDRLLQEVAGALRTHLRRSDVIARYGGDEFAVLLPVCSIEESRQAIARFLADIGEHRCTVGIACSTGEDSVQDLVSRADRALYEGKEGGRNRIVLDA